MIPFVVVVLRDGVLLYIEFVNFVVVEGGAFGFVEVRVFNPIGGHQGIGDKGVISDGGGLLQFGQSVWSPCFHRLRAGVE